MSGQKLRRGDMMGFIGGILGVIFGTLLGKFVDWLAHRYLESEQITGVGTLSVVPLWLAIGALLFGTLVGILSGLYPARAAKLDPVQARDMIEGDKSKSTFLRFLVCQSTYFPIYLSKYLNTFKRVSGNSCTRHD
jgi:predicted lysophospholipase L1 biosynthesis ABC-type transport system permease subunit